MNTLLPRSVDERMDFFSIETIQRTCAGDMRSCLGQMQRGNKSGRPKQALFSIQVCVRAHSARAGSVERVAHMFLFLIFLHSTSTFMQNASVYSPSLRFPVLSFPMFLPSVHGDVDRGRFAG